LMSVTIPSSVINVGKSVFIWCGSLSLVQFEGLPPGGLSSAAIDKSANIRYNAYHTKEWESAILQCGFTNAEPYWSGGFFR